MVLTCIDCGFTADDTEYNFYVGEDLNNVQCQHCLVYPINEPGVHCNGCGDLITDSNYRLCVVCEPVGVVETTCDCPSICSCSDDQEHCDNCSC